MVCVSLFAFSWALGRSWRLSVCTCISLPVPVLIVPGTVDYLYCTAPGTSTLVPVLRTVPRYSSYTWALVRTVPGRPGTV